MITNTTWLLLQFFLSLALIWLCWIVYPHWCDYWYRKFSKAEHDEHEDVEQSKG